MVTEIAIPKPVTGFGGRSKNNKNSF